MSPDKPNTGKTVATNLRVFIIMQKYSEYNSGCPPDNPITEKITWKKD